MANYNNKNRQTMKPIEIRYNKALQQMRGLRVSLETKDLQTDIMWLKKEIEDYGYTFFPNFYVFEKVVEFERLVGQLQSHPSTK